MGIHTGKEHDEYIAAKYKFHWFWGTCEGVRPEWTAAQMAKDEILDKLDEIKK